MRGEQSMLILQMVIYGYSLLVLLFLLLDSRANKRRYSRTSNYFRIVIYVTMLILFVEAVSFAVDRRPGALMYWAGYLSNAFLFILNLAPLSLVLVRQRRRRDSVLCRAVGTLRESRE